MKSLYETGRIRLYGSVLLCALLLCGCKGSGQEACRESLFAMDTYMTLTVYGEQAQEGISMAREEILRLERMLSTTETSGMVARLNREKKLRVSEEIAGLWSVSYDIFRQTEGAFDVTIYPVMKAWGFTGDTFRVPEKWELQRLLERVDSNRVSLQKDALILELPPDGELDFGGIAKGYAGEQLAEEWKEMGIHSALLDLGGNIQLVGSKPDGSDFKIGIRNPLEETGTLGTLCASDKAIVTSGGYERYFEEGNKRYHHILDPKTGYPADSDILSATVVCEKGSLADGYSTALFVMGREKAISFWREYGDRFEMILYTEDGMLYVTEGLEETFLTDLDRIVVRRDSGER